MRYQTGKVNIRPLKNFAFKRLPKHQPLRDLLLSEHDELDVNEFVAKLDIWLKLLRRRHS